MPDDSTYRESPALFCDNFKDKYWLDFIDPCHRKSTRGNLETYAYSHEIKKYILHHWQYATAAFQILIQIPRNCISYMTIKYIQSIYSTAGKSWELEKNKIKQNICHYENEKSWPKLWHIRQSTLSIHFRFRTACPVTSSINWYDSTNQLDWSNKKPIFTMLWNRHEHCFIVFMNAAFIWQV